MFCVSGDIIVVVVHSKIIIIQLEYKDILYKLYRNDGLMDFLRNPLGSLVIKKTTIPNTSTFIIIVNCSGKITSEYILISV